MLYEAFVALSVMFISAFAFQGATSGALEGWGRHVFQAYLFLVLGLYFVWSWVRGGQTLPMKTWRLRLVLRDGGSLTPPVAVLRYTLAWLSLLCAGMGFAWALVDKESQFLHDRLAGTRVVRL